MPGPSASDSPLHLSWQPLLINPACSEDIQLLSLCTCLNWSLPFWGMRGLLPKYFLFCTSLMPKEYKTKQDSPNGIWIKSYLGGRHKQLCGLRIWDKYLWGLSLTLWSHFSHLCVWTLGWRSVYHLIVTPTTKMKLWPTSGLESHLYKLLNHPEFLPVLINCWPTINEKGGMVYTFYNSLVDEGRE